MRQVDTFFVVVLGVKLAVAIVWLIVGVVLA